jgi:hypothetical protein
MPLIKSGSESAFKKNVGNLMDEYKAGTSKHVTSPQQALAIAYSLKRRGKDNGGTVSPSPPLQITPQIANRFQRRLQNANSDDELTSIVNDAAKYGVDWSHMLNKATGGKVKGYDTGGTVDPVTAVVNALQAGSGQTSASGTAGSNPGMNQSTPTSASAAAVPPTSTSLLPATSGVTNSGATSAPTTSLTQASPATLLNSGIGSGGGWQPNNNTGLVNPQIGQQVGGTQTVLQPGTNAGVTQMNRGGVPGLAFGGMPQMPWFARNEARGLVHSGPIMSAVPGRTDRHPLDVPSGAYVLPADHVSSLGQGNTQAGMHILNRMFGTPGKMPMGGGAPKPPRPMGIPGDKGGARGDATGKPVPVIVAGGEYIIHPSIVARIGDGSVKRGHAILDKWVISNRKKHVATLKKLPGPAKA